VSQPERSCPNCGYGVNPEATVCGNCGTQLGRPLATRLAPARAGRVIFLALVLAGVGGFFALREPISDLVERAQEEIAGRPEQVESAVPAAEGTVPGYAHVREVVAALNRGGLSCKRTKIDSSDDFLETGSCQSRGTHVQINLYFQQQTIEFAETEIFGADSPFTFAHKDNWWIISTRPIVRAARTILGGTIQTP
jgi:hypothetical protein